MMKKSLVLITISLLALVLCACSNSQNNYIVDDGDGMANPIVEVTLDEMATELGLKGIDFGEGVTVSSAQKIDGDDIIYSIDLTDGGKDYNVRIILGNEERDISGVYLDGKISHAIYDSADAEQAPSVSVDVSNEAAVARCVWNGYVFSLSSDKTSLEDMQKQTIKLSKIISNENKL